MNILFGIAGGISFLLMIYGFILVGTSNGDDKKLQGAKETITSAITGLLVSIFALFIFRLIAVDILKIPGLN
jgi:glucose uptake protein GlcU